MKTYTEMET